MDFDFTIGTSVNPEDDSKKVNVMQGKGNIVRVDHNDIDCEAKFKLYSPINCEMDLISNSNNTMTCRVDVVEIPTNKYIHGDILDLYLYNQTPLINFDNASLLSGNNDDKEFKSFIKFNNIEKIDKKIMDNMLNATIRFYSMQDSDQIFKLYSLDNDLNDKITCVRHPNKNNLLGTVQHTQDDLRVYEINVSDYIKKIYDRKMPNYGILIENENFIQLFSSNSNTHKPELIIDWVNPNVYINKSKIQCEADILLASSMVCEVDFNDELPKLDCEAILSIDTVGCETSVLFPSHVDAECLISFPPDQISIPCEMELSNISPTRVCEADFRIYNSIEAEVNLNVVDTSKLDCEVDLLLGKTLVNETIFGYETHTECELNLMCKTTNSIDCEAILSIDTIGCETNLMPSSNIECEVNLDVIDSEKIDCETYFYKKGMMSTVDSETNILLSKPIDCEIDLKPRVSSYIESEATIKFINKSYIENEADVIFPAMKYIDCEADIRKSSHIDNEMTLYIKRESNMDCEMLLGGKLALDCQIEIRRHSDLDCDVDLLNQSYVENEAKLLLTKCIECETDILLASSMECEVDFHNERESSMDCETNLKIINESTINCECDIINKNKVIVRIIEV